MDNNSSNLVPISRTLRTSRQSLISRLSNFSSLLDDDDEELPAEQSQIISNIKASISSSSLEAIDTYVKRLTTSLKKANKEKKELEKYKENYEKMVNYIPRYIIKHISSNNKCSICLEENVNFDSIYVITPCFHIFHEKCIKESQNFNFSCPLCRNNLKHSFYKKIKFSLSDIGTDNF